jgi:hypothetical protein
MGKMVGAGAGYGVIIFDKLEQEPHKKWTGSATMLKSTTGKEIKNITELGPSFAG